MKLLLLFLFVFHCSAQVYDEPEWFSDLPTIRGSLIEGKNVRLRNALPPQLLDFDFDNIEWNHAAPKNEYGKSGLIDMNVNRVQIK